MSISLKDVVKLSIGLEVMLQNAGAPKRSGINCLFVKKFFGVSGVLKCYVRKRLISAD